MMLKQCLGFSTVVGLVLALTPVARAQTIFTEDFNTYAGNQNASQSVTGLPVAHTGSVAGWSNAGDGTMRPPLFAVAAHHP